MKTRFLLWMTALLGAVSLQAQPFLVDCSCLATQSVLITNACQAVIPDLCQFTNCWRSTIVPPQVLNCSQNPAAGTPVGPGSHSITVTITDPNGTQQACALIFQVNPPPGAVSLICATNKTVECGTPWIFDPPTATNVCCPIAGVPGGAFVFLASLVTNGTCPEMITATWQVFDNCMLSATCTQLVTVVDTTAPVMNCTCLTNGLNPLSIPMTVTNCQDFIPDLCPLALSCTVEACGPLHCFQTPPPGTPVTPGVHPITITMLDCALNAATCTVNFTVVSPATGPFALLCAPNKTVQCGSTWIFDPPVATNTCCPILGIPGGVLITILSTVTNGACPEIITQTWEARDGCGAVATCSQTVTVVDTVPPILTCVCITNSAAIPVILTVTQCNGTIPDLCLPALTCAFDACGITCSQTPLPGTIVGPGVYPITVTVTDCASNSASCTFNYTVVSPGPFAIICAPNKTVECGTTWMFDQPRATNNCCPVGGTTSGVTVVSVTTVTNGFCPEVITRTWTVRDGCNNTVSCSQIVTVVDTTPPVLDCNCLTSTAGNPLLPPLIVTACLTNIPDFCPAAMFCATDACGPLTCSQSLLAGTIVGPGSYNITITITDCASNSVSCTVHFTVFAPPGGCCVQPPGNMVAWWPLDELNGATLFADATGNNHTAVVESGGALGNPFSPSAAVGMVAGSSYFIDNSTRGRAVNAALLNFGFASFSMDCWFWPVDQGPFNRWQPFIDKFNPNTLTGYTVGITNYISGPNNFGRVAITVGDGTASTYYSVATVNMFAWNFVGIIVDRAANTVQFNINGAIEPPIALTLGGNINNTLDLLIGATRTGMNATETRLDEIELFNRALATNELTDIWAGGSFGKCKTNNCIVSIFCPTNLIATASCTQACAVVNYLAPLVANGVLAGCAPPPGTCFPVGVSTVTCTAISPCGPPASCSFTITVNAATNCCVSQTNAWNSGMGGTNALPPGTPDPNYVLVSAPPGGCTGPAQVLHPATIPAPPWVTNGPNSQWIGASLGANCQEGVYHYRLCFYLPCTDGASIIGQWAVDDHGAIHLNGQPTGNTVPSQQYPNLPGYGWFPVSITNGFVCGTNCLDFYVTNANIGINPTGFRAELTNVFDDCCCGPLEETSSYHSGVNASGLMPLLSLDPQLVVTCAPAGAPTGPAQVTSVNPNWMPNGPDSQWLAPVGNPGLPGGVYCYSYRFNLPPCTNGIPNYAVKGQWMGDDAGTIYVNGIPSGNDLPNGWAFTNWHPISITSGLMPGLNTLTFYVTNASAGDTGIRVELTNSASCCDCTNPPCVVSITCPPNLTALTCSNSAVVPYLSPIASSTCGNIVSLVCAPPTGSAFPLGPTTVTCTATDAGANSASCSFIVTVALDPNCCTTTPVLTLNSGAGTSGVLPAGSLDPQFLTGAPMFAMPNPWVPNSISPSWVPNSALSKWVSPRATLSSAPGGVYIYTNRFFLCSTNQAALTGRWTADDTGGIWLNGAPTGNTLPASLAFTAWHPVNITSGFVPGWNTLTFRVTNYYASSLTGLRTEITGTACCNTCVAIVCPPNQTRTNCPPGGLVTYPAPAATSACGNIVSLACTPASGSFFPLGTNTVTCTAIDSQGSAATCSFSVIMRPAAGPVSIMCPPNQTVFTCSNSLMVKFKPKATGHTGPIVCTPPSGATFPLGTNIVTCTATNICGQSASCSFLIIVKPHLLGVPAQTITAGNPDNFALPIEPSPQNACMVTAFSGFPFWKGFDQVATDRLFGHRFTGLPNNIVQAELIIRMRPVDNFGADNDGLFLGLGPTCTFASFLYGQSIKVLPGAVPATGGTWVQSSNGPTTFTLNLGALNPAFITKLNTDQYLDVVVHDDTTVDYMQLRLWRCPPPSHGIGVPFDVVGGATVAQRPAGPIIGIPLPAICVFPNPNLPSGIHLQPGAAKTLSFTTVLDFEAPEGAGLDLVLPPDPRNTNGMPFLSFRSKGAKGYCVKTAKLYDDEPDISYRSIAVGTNGDLLPSVIWDAANIETNVLLWLAHLPGVTSVVMTVTLDLETREVSLEFPECIWTPVDGRKGWDGCIYGNGTPSKGTNKTARLILQPAPPHTPLPPVFDTTIFATGLSEFLVEDPEIETMGRKWGDGHVTLMKAYDDGETERLSFITVAEGGGVHTDLGNAATVSVGFHHFENGDIPNEEQLFRLTGPIRGLTNRPAPPQIPLRLAEIPGGVACTVDFSDLAAESITVQLWSNGVLIGEGTGPGSSIPPESPLIIDRWPDRFGRPALNEGYLALSSAGEPFTVSGIMGDELRFIPGLPPGVEFPPYFSRLEVESGDGMDNVLFDLQTTLACPPDAVIHIDRSTEGVTLTWDCDGYLLQGAEEVTGPWFDLGVESPVPMSANRPWRFFRLRGR